MNLIPADVSSNESIFMISSSFSSMYISRNGLILFLFKNSSTFVACYLLPIPIIEIDVPCYYNLNLCQEISLSSLPFTLTFLPLLPLPLNERPKQLEPAEARFNFCNSLSSH